MMKDMDGMETARKLRADKFRGFLVFIMVLKEMVFQSFEVQAYDYLVKPAQIENELSKKDNDTYRRQNASFDNSD
jgi:two-component system response regulator LytT